MTASASALKLLQNTNDIRTSYEQLHRINGRANPTQMMKYKHAIQLNKVYNSTDNNEDWLDLNFNQTFNRRNRGSNDILL